MIKHCFPVIIDTVVFLINLSLSTGTVPLPLKNSRVVPIFKDGLRGEYGNYRPISLISSFGKLVEKIVSQQLTYYLETNNLLFKHQYGFRKGRDCQQPLVQFIERIRSSLERKSNDLGLVVFIDLKKAFDRSLVIYFYTN